MITYQTFHEIKNWQNKGLTAGQIAQKVIVSDTTARLWMGRDNYQFYRSDVPRKSKLDPYKDDISRLLADFEGYKNT